MNKRFTIRSVISRIKKIGRIKNKSIEELKEEAKKNSVDLIDDDELCKSIELNKYELESDKSKKIKYSIEEIVEMKILYDQHKERNAERSVGDIIKLINDELNNKYVKRDYDARERKMNEIKKKSIDELKGYKYVHNHSSGSGYKIDVLVTFKKIVEEKIFKRNYVDYDELVKEHNMVLNNKDYDGKFSSLGDKLVR